MGGRNFNYVRSRIAWTCAIVWSSVVYQRCRDSAAVAGGGGRAAILSTEVEGIVDATAASLGRVRGGWIGGGRGKEWKGKSEEGDEVDWGGEVHSFFCRDIGIAQRR